MLHHVIDDPGNMLAPMAPLSHSIQPRGVTLVVAGSDVEQAAVVPHLLNAKPRRAPCSYTSLYAWARLELDAFVSRIVSELRPLSSWT